MLGRPLGRVEQGQEPSAGEGEDTVGGDEGMPHRLVTGVPGTVDGRRVGHRHVQAHQAGETFGTTPQFGRQRLFAPHHSAALHDRGQFATSDEDRDPLFGLQQPSHGQHHVMLPFDRLVPRQQLVLTDDQRVHLAVASGGIGLFGLHGAPLRLEEPQSYVQFGVRSHLGEAFGAAGRVFAGARRRVGRRHQDTELPAGLVLRRRSAVGVEHVALVEHGVRDGLDMVECCSVGHRTPSTESSASTW